MGDLGDILRYYREAGVDAALEDKPVNRFAAPPAAKTGKDPVADGAQDRTDNTGPRPVSGTPGRNTSAAQASPARPPEAATPDEGQAERARDMAAKAASLGELQLIMEAFDGCNLKFTAKSLVFGNGDPEARLMIIGEAPGRDEDIEGLPFVGRSGRLLDRMLAAIGLERGAVYVTNVIPWRPPGNRTPTPHETEICRPFIERHIELVAPDLILALGAPSAKLLTGKTQGILSIRGSWLTHRTRDGREITVMPTLHPAYLLRNPAQKKFAWRDFLAVKAKLAG